MKQKHNKIIEYYGRIIDRIFQPGKNMKTIAVVSAGPKEGRTTTCAGLAIAAAFLKPGKKILVADFDFRNPDLHNMLQVQESNGLRDVLGHEEQLENITFPVIFSNLFLACAGSAPIDLPDVFQEESMRTLVEELKSNFDMIICDSPPVNNYADSRIFAGFTDGIILLARAEKSGIKDLTEAQEKISSLNSTIIGAILTDYKAPFPSFIAEQL
jgi:protein-tyrosine kinase